MPDSTTDSIATLALAQYEIPVGVSIIPKGRDWASRQEMNYEAIKGLIKNDFLGLNDWADQINLYSSTNLTILKPAYTAIKALIPLNTRVEVTLAPDPASGLMVGQDLLTAVGLDEAFTIPQDILTDNSALTGALS